MRSYPSCWNTTLAQLGFRRKRRKTTKRIDQYRRRSLFEALEPRQMLSGDPLLLLDLDSEETVVAAGFEIEPVFAASEPEFFLIQPEFPAEIIDTPVVENVDESGVVLPAEDLEIEPVFAVETIQTKAGPKAIISFNPSHAAGPPTTLQELHLELRQDGQVLQSYDILIDLAEESFREDFLADRVQKLEVAEIDSEVERSWLRERTIVKRADELMNFVGPLTLDDSVRLVELEAKIAEQVAPTTDLLTSLAKRQADRGDLLADDLDREHFYKQIEQNALELKLDQASAQSDAEQQAVADRQQLLRNTALLIAKDLEQDLKSENTDVALAAQQVRDELVAISDPMEILFAGLGVDREVQRKFTQSGDETSLSFVETGHYVFDDNLEIDLGKHQAMVQVTRANNFRIAAAISVSESPAVEDGSIEFDGSQINGGTSTTQRVAGLLGFNEETLVRFNIGEVVDFDNPTTIASAAFQLTENSAGSGDVDVYLWNGLLKGPTGSVTDWDETNLTWDHVQGTLDLPGNLSEFTKIDTWTTGTTFDVDVTTQVQRALLYGDANGDGVFDAAGTDGDIEAFHLAVTNWDAYVAEYGPRANSAADLLARTDGGLGDGTVDTADISDFFRRHGVSQGDYNLDGTVQDNQDSGPDGLDWAVFNANYGLTGAKFTQGDGNFDGTVDDDDFDIWFDRKSEDSLTAEEPELFFWLRPEDTVTEVEFATQEHTTLDGPTLVVTEQPDLALNKFSVDGSNLVVDYAVLGDTFTDVKVQIYKVGSPDTLLHETAVQSGTLGNHEVLIATSVLSTIVEGDAVYAKVIGTPSAGTQSNTTNDQLDFEFSTASTQTVNSLDDAGMDTLLRDKHTLRELIDANDSLGWFDTINFDANLFTNGSGVISLGDHSGDNVAERIWITEDIDIQGPGAHLLAIDARRQSRVFTVTATTTATISGLTIAGGGNVTVGGGIYNQGDLTLQSVSVLDNQTIHTNGSGSNNGGGIYSTNGTLRLYNSTIDGNRARWGGGLRVDLSGTHELIIDSSTISNNLGLGDVDGLDGLGGGMYLYAAPGTTGTATATNSTFSGNRSYQGAGLSIRHNDTNMTLVNVTVTDNHTIDENDVLIAGGYAGGIQAWSPSNTHEVTLHNTIVAGNTSSNASFPDVWGDIGGTTGNLSSHNILGLQHTSVSTSSAGHSQLFDGDANNNQVGDETMLVDPGLAPLNEYGGPTLTHALYDTSPAIDAADDTLAPVEGDQRGFDGDDFVAGGSVRDTGAFEYQYENIVAASMGPETGDYEVTRLDDVSDKNDGRLTLREAINLAAIEGPDSVVTFQEGSTGTIELEELQSYFGRRTSNSLVVNSGMTIMGPGADHVTIDALPVGQSVANSAFLIDGPGTLNVTISGLTITGTNTSDGHIRNKENLTLKHSVVSGASSRGIYNSGTLTVEDSEITDNEIVGKGGGIYNYDGDVTIRRTTIHNNTATLGGGIANYGSGDPAVYDDATLTVIDSTISGNHATADGGGIFTSRGIQGAADANGNYTYPTVVVTNSTISGNFAVVSASGKGGGIYSSGGDLILTNTTITDNKANTSGGGIEANIQSYQSYGGYQGYIYFDFPMIANNTIIAGNTLSDDSDSDVEGDQNFSLVNSKHNLIGDAATAGGLQHDNLGNIVGMSGAGTIDPKLSTLGDHGGPTQTHALLPLSEAIGNGDPMISGQNDQRGFGQVGDLDIGSFEFIDYAASDIIVTTLADNNIQPGKLSLRQALDLAREFPGDNTISFDESLFVGSSGTIILSYDSPNDGDELADTLTVDSNVVIEGPGAHQLIIDAQASATDQRRAITTIPGIVATVAGLTITGGYATIGGGIFNDNAELTLRDVNVVENTAGSTGSGGGIYTAGGLLELESGVGGGVVIAANSAGAGGGIFGNNGDITITGATIGGAGIDGNVADNSQGGGIRFQTTLGNLLDINATTIEGNKTVSAGGGIYTSASSVTTLDETIVRENTAATFGGGLQVDGTLDVTLSELEHNTAQQGGGVYMVLRAGKQLSLTQSSIMHNIAEHPTALAVGGGIYVNGVLGATANEVYVVDSTIAHNVSRASAPGSTANNSAGGIHLNDVDEVEIVYSTISSNTADGDSGGVEISNVDDAKFINTTIAYNESSYGNVGGVGIINSPSVGAYNTIIDENRALGNDDNVQQVLLNATNSSLISLSSDVGLAALGDYGGVATLPSGKHTETHALKAGSPAIDAGEAFTANPEVTPPPTDQRGYDRDNIDGIGGVIDIGSYEVQVQEPTTQAQVASGDFNGDGREDFVYLETTARGLDVALGGDRTAGSGLWATLGAGNWTNFQSGDFNGDGRDDLAYQNSSNGEWTIAVSDSTQFNVTPLIDSAEQSVATNWQITSVGDFDDDGSDELIGRVNANSPWEVLQYDEGRASVVESWETRFSTPADWTFFVGDANRDGRDDLIAGRVNGSVEQWEVAFSQLDGSGSPEFAAAVDVGTWFDESFSGQFDQGFHRDLAHDSNSVDAEGPIEKLFNEFAWVYNNVELELYLGLMKGPQATLETQRGNPWDQAALLAKELTDAGFNAEIISGQITVTEQELMDWVGTKTIAAADKIIKNSLDPNRSDADEQNGRLRHAWVRVEVPTANGMQPIDLDASWKFKDRQHGIDLPDDIDDTVPYDRGVFNEFAFLKDPDDQLPIEFFEDQVMEYLVENEPGKSLTDVAYDGPIIQQQFDDRAFVSDNHLLNPISSVVEGTFQNIADNDALAHTHRVRISVDTWSYDIVIPESSLDSFSILRDATGFEFFVNGTSEHDDNSIPTSTKLVLKHAVPGQTLANGREFDFVFDSGGNDGRHYTITLDANQHSQVELDRRRTAINTAAADVVDVEDINEVLDYIGAKYWYDYNRHLKQIDGLTQAVGVDLSVNSGLVTADNFLIDPSPGDFSHLQFPIVPRSTGIDLPNGSHRPNEIDSPNVDDEAFQLGGYNASALEHAVIEEVINNESISTIRGLKDAYIGDPILTGEEINSVWVIESVEEGSSRKVYIRGELGEQATNDPAGGPISLPYDPDETSKEVTSEAALRAAFPGHEYGSNQSHLTALWTALDDDDIIGTATALVPQELSYVGNSLTSWGGTVYVVARDLDLDSDLKVDKKAHGYKIASVFDNRGSTDGGHASGVTIPQNVFIEPAATPIVNFNGDPVNVLNGNMFRDELDIAMPNTGVPLDFARHYDSQAKHNIGLGVGWVHSFSDRIIKISSQEYVWLTSEGVRHTFKFENNEWKSPNALLGTFDVLPNLDFVYRETDGIEHHFEGMTGVTFGEDIHVGRLEKIVDRNGHGVQVKYANSTTFNIDLVEDVRAPFVDAVTPARYLDFTYSNGRITKIEKYIDESTPLLVGTWNYEYTNDSAEILNKVTNPESEFVEYQYYTSGSAKDTIFRIIEADDSYHEYEYYPNGRTFRVKEGIFNGTYNEQSSHSFSYNLFRNLTEFTDENGNVETYIHQEDGQLTRHIYDDRSRTVTEWGVEDVNGDIIDGTQLLMRSLTDETGAVETFEYYTDDTGPDAFKFRRLKTSTAKHYPGDTEFDTEFDYEQATESGYEHIVNNSQIVVGHGSADTRTTELDYDARGRLTLITDPLLQETDFDYFANNHATTYLRGLLESETRAKSNVFGSPTGDTTVVFAYNSAGLVTSATRDSLPAGSTEYHHTGLPTIVTDAEGVATESSYDAVGRRTSFSQLGVAGTADDLTSSFEYDERGRLEKSTDALGRETTFVYDRRGNVTQQTSADGSTIFFEYDDVGNRVAAIDGNGRKTRFVYDRRNRLIQTIFADGFSERIRYDGAGRIASTVNALGHETHFEYDVRGLLKKTTFAAGVTNVEAITTNDYNQFGELIESIDGEGNVTQMVRDALGRVTKTHVLDTNDNPANPALSPLSVVTIDYDPQGNVEQTTVYDVSQLTNQTEIDSLLSDDPRSLITTHSDHVQVTKNYYDVFNRPTDTVYDDGARVSTEYDDAGRVKFTRDELYHEGQLHRETEFVYDKYGRLVETILPDPDDTGPLSSPVTYVQYDAAGNRIATRQSDQDNTLSSNTWFEYDALNRVVATTDAEGGRTSVVYDQAGQLITAIDALGRAAYTLYDNRGRAKLTRSADPDGSDPGRAAETQFRYDAAGNLAEQTDNAGRKNMFYYDARNRLEREEIVIGTPVQGSRHDVGFIDKGVGVTDNQSGTGFIMYSESSVDDRFDPDPNQFNAEHLIAVRYFNGAWEYNDNNNWRPLTTESTDVLLAEIDFGTSSNTDSTVTSLEGTNEVFQGIRKGYFAGDLTFIADRWGDETVGAVPEGEFFVTGTFFTAGASTDTTLIESTVERSFTYDDNGNLLSETDTLDRTTEFTYDELNRIIKTTLPDPDEGGLLQKPSTDTFYDGYGNITSTVENRGGGTDVRTTAWTYDDRNRVLTETLDDGGANEVTTKFTYDAVGNLLTQIDDYTPVPSNGFNYQTDFDYDALNRLTTETVYPDADTFIETASAYDALGNLVRVTETTTSGVSPNQLTHEVATEFGYDDLGRQTHLTRDVGRDLQSTTRFAYDAVGNLLSTVDALGQTSHNSYDRLDRLDESIAPDPDGGGGSVPAAISKFTYDVAGNLATQTNGEGETERFFYDSLDRLIRSHDGRDVTLDAPTLRSYDSEGNLLTFTDPVGNTTSYAYDDLDRLTSETITLGVNAVSRDYVYNAQGNLEEVVDRNGRQRTFEYDRLDRRTYERWWNSTNDEIATLGWQYDSLGRVTQARDTQDADTSPDHYVESFFYDALDRVTAHYNYDASATLATTNPPVVQLYAYDLLEASDASDFVRTGYQQWVVDAFGFATLANSTFFTDRLGRLARLTETAGAVDNLVEKQIDFAYDANDRLTGIRRVSGQFDTGYAYDRAGRVTGISHLATGNSQLPFTSYSYGYDKADRIIGQISEHDKTLGAFSDSSVLATDVELFQFDDAGQLKQDGQRTYDYDAGGNRDDASITVGEHNRLLEDANYGYIYDLEGNLTTRFVDSIDNGVFDPGEDYTVYTWDYRNRLTRVKDFNGTTLEENTKYRYNADDQQVEREAFIGAFQTAHEHYVYDGAQRVLALDPDGDLKHRYTWGPGVDQLLVDEVFDSSTNLVEETLFAANDHLGSVNQLVDNSGTVVEHREYDSFGAIDKVFDEAGSKVYDKTDPAANLNVLQSTVAFAGREIDVASGLYYNRARWYDSASGRFISVDPAEDGNNWYAYAGSDPINFRDPFGFRQQHPLDVFAGGHGSGVVVPQNTNIVSGAVANAARSIGNFIAETSNSVGSAINTGSRQFVSAFTPSSSSSQFVRELTPGNPIVPRQRQDLPGVRAALENPERFAITNHQGQGNFVVDLQGGGVRFVTGPEVQPIDTRIQLAGEAARIASGQADSLTLVQDGLIMISPVHDTLRGGFIAVTGSDFFEPGLRFDANDRLAAFGMLFAPGNSTELRHADDLLDRLQQARRAGLSSAEARLQELRGIKAGRNVPPVDANQKVQRHHLQTNKNNVSTAAGGPFTPQFEKLAKQRGVTLNDPANIVDLPGHQGPHPRYNAEVFERLDRATTGRKGKAFNDAYDKALLDIGRETLTPGTKLNRLATGQGGG